MKADLTKTKNKSLVGADLRETSFLLANLSGVNLSDTTLAATNFLRTTLIGVDFTNLSNIPNGVLFVKSTLTNSNFEGVNMSPIHVKIDTFENKAYLKQEYESGILSARTLVVTLFDSGLDNKQILSTEVNGNDLVVEYIYINNFRDANLENANFKNAILWNVKFHSANLANADLSGADLSGTLLNHANLSNANLQGADLSGASLSGANLSGAKLSGLIYDQYTILNCLNHDICAN